MLVKPNNAKKVLVLSVKAYNQPYTLTSLRVVFSLSTLYFKLAIFLDSAARD